MDPLSQLSDIVEPTTVSTWPLAMGWWIVLALALLLVSSLSMWFLRRRKRRRPLRVAKRQLQRLKQTQQIISCADANALLKQLFLCYHERSSVASLYGQAWRDKVLSSLPARYQTDMQNDIQQLTESHYQVGNTADKDWYEPMNAFLRHTQLAKLAPVLEVSHA